MTSAALGNVAFRLALRSLAAVFRRWQLYSSPPRLGETNSDRLFWRTGAVFAFANVFHFFAHKFASLSAGGLAFPLVLARAFNYFLFGHNRMVTPLTSLLDVNKKAAGVTSHRFAVSRSHSYRPRC